MNRTYRAAIIGRTGGGNYGHSLDVVYNGLPNVEVVAVADPDPDGRAACVARLSTARSSAPAQFADYTEMLQQVRPDLVSVAPSWPDCHHEMVLACAASDVKGIYCEKPFAQTLAQADEMLAACQQSGTYIAVAHQNRAVPHLQRIKELMQEGAIGKLMRIRGKAKDDTRGGAEDLMVLGTHILDLMRAIAGDPLWALGHVRQNDHEMVRTDVQESTQGLASLGGNNLTGYFAFPAGVAGTYDSYVSDGGARLMGMWLEGTEGTITFHGGWVKQAYICRTPQWTPELGNSAWERIEVPDWEQDLAGRLRSNAELLNITNQRMVQGLIDCIENGSTHFSSGEDARWAMEMCFAVPESQRSGSRVSFPMQNRGNPWAMLERDA